MTENNQSNLSHIAIIMDGNRRWAVEHGLPKMMGHSEATKNVKKIVKAAQEKGLQFLTLWALSTENLKERGPEELKHLFSLFEKLGDELDASEENNLKIQIIGDISKLPDSTQKKLNAVVEKTKNHTGLTLNLAINYGGRDELIRAVRKIINSGISADQITEEVVNQNLDTAGMPEPELFIRTGGNQRLSGYLPWQSIYAEIYFTKIQWPAFSEKDLDDAIEWYKTQKRNRGK